MRLTRGGTLVLTWLVVLGATACRPTLGEGVSPCQSVDLPAMEDRPQVTVARDDQLSGCRRRLELTGESSDLGGSAATRLMAAGWLLDRHDTGVWTGWGDQGDARFAVTITPTDEGGRGVQVDVAAAGPAAPPPVELDLDDLVPVGAPRIESGVVLIPTIDGVQAFDLHTGERTWSMPGCEGGSWASPFPGPDAELPVVLFCGTGLLALDPTTGDVAWQQPLRDHPDRVRVSRTMVVLQSSASVRVLDLASGEERWTRHSFGDAAIAVDDERVYVGNDHKLRALDGELGVADWAMLGEIGSVATTDDAVFVRTSPTYPDGPDSNRLVRLDPETGERVWSVAYHTRYDGSQIVGTTDDAVVLAGDDHVGVFDAGTGEERWWEYTRDAALLAVGSDHVVVADSIANQVVAFDAERHRQDRFLGTTCGVATEVAGTTAVQVSCTEDNISVAAYDLRPPA